MNEIQKSTHETERIIQPENQFKGFTLEELRYQRALILLQKEFCRSKIMRNVNNLQKANPFSSSPATTSLPGRIGGIASKLLSGLNYLDYAMLGFSLFGSARKVFSFFRKKK